MCDTTGQRSQLDGYSGMANRLVPPLSLPTACNHCIHITVPPRHPSRLRWPCISESENSGLQVLQDWSMDLFGFVNLLFVILLTCVKGIFHQNSTNSQNSVWSLFIFLHLVKIIILCNRGLYQLESPILAAIPDNQQHRPPRSPEITRNGR